MVQEFQVDDKHGDVSRIVVADPEVVVAVAHALSSRGEPPEGVDGPRLSPPTAGTAPGSRHDREAWETSAAGPTCTPRGWSRYPGAAATSSEQEEDVVIWFDRRVGGPAASR